MPSVTIWNRLEPYPYSDILRPSLRAALHDPLWLLARQWQLGEFQGEDNGSPIWVEITGECYSLNCYRPGNASGKGISYDPFRVPLECQVESELLDSQNLRLRVESGLHFLKMLGHLAKVYKSDYLKVAGLQLPTADELSKVELDTRRFVVALADRAIDGKRLYELTNDGPGITLADPSNETELNKAILAWRKTYRPLFTSDVSLPAWAGDRLEYNFDVASPMPLVNRTQGRVMDETVLRAAEYSGGHLDWPSFSILAKPESMLGAASSPGQPVSHAGPPAPVSYTGMPLTRFWQFEDGHVNFGAVDVAADDLGRLLLIEYGLVYGNDFFLVPLELPIGSLCRIGALRVFNTFGDESVVEPAGDDQWSMFALTVEGGEADNRLLFLPAALYASQKRKAREGQLPPVPDERIIEEVILARDEMANLVWAIERQVTNAMQRPLLRYDQWVRSSSQSPSDAAPAAEAQGDSPSDPVETVDGQTVAKYRLINTVPDYWCPMELDSAGQHIGLRIYNKERLPQGRILRETDPNSFVLYEEEVPRSGIRVQRAYQYVRWVDGSHHVWIGRRKAMGHGEASSGLRFDFPEVT